MTAAILVLNQGVEREKTIRRGIERTIGTSIGVVLAFWSVPHFPANVWLMFIMGGLQFMIEILVVRTYSLASIFITVMALAIGSGGHFGDVSPSLFVARGADTLLGCAIAILVTRKL